MQTFIVCSCCGKSVVIENKMEEITPSVCKKCEKNMMVLRFKSHYVTGRHPYETVDEALGELAGMIWDLQQEVKGLKYEQNK